MNQNLVMKLNFFAGVMYNNQIFFSDFNNINGLFSLNIKSQKVSFLRLFEKEKLSNKLHRAAFLYKSEAWFIPQKAKYIANINLKTLNITYYDIPYHNKNEIDNDYCAYIKGHIVQERYLYLIPYNIDTVLIIDMEDHKLYPFYDVINLETELIADGLIIEDKLLLFPWEGKYYTSVDLKTNERCKNVWPFREGAFCSAHYIDKKIWFSPIKENYILCIDMGTGKSDKLLLPNTENQYCDMMQVDDKLIFFPYQTSNFLIVNLRTFDMQIELVKSEEEIFSKSPNVISQINAKEGGILTMGLIGCVLMWEKNRTVIPIEIDRSKFIGQVYDYLKKNGYFDKLVKKQDLVTLLKILGMDINLNFGDLEKFLGLGIIIQLIPYIGNLEYKIPVTVGKTIWENIGERKAKRKEGIYDEYL